MNDYKSATFSNNDIFIYIPIFSLGILYDLSNRVDEPLRYTLYFLSVGFRIPTFLKLIITFCMICYKLTHFLFIYYSIMQVTAKINTDYVVANTK